MFLVPNPKINLTAPAVQNFMEPLTLTCEVTTVKGITSGMTITWTSLDNEIRRVENAIGDSVDNSVVYRDQFFISLTSDGRYDCKAVINSTSQLQSTASIRLELTCKCMVQAHICMHTYIHTYIRMLLYYTCTCIRSNYVATCISNSYYVTN